MSIFFRSALLVAWLCGWFALPASALTSEEIVAKAKGSVLRILVEVKPGDKKLIERYRLKDVRKTIRHQVGTGFAITKDGNIVTSHLILPSASLLKGRKIFVRLPKEGDQVAEEVTTDADRRIACLRIKKFDLVPLAMETNTPKVGNDVFAMGFPYAAATSDITDQEATFTAGKVGALKQTQQESTLVQTNTAINPGSSGGPLLDRDGNVVGVMIGSADDTPENRFIKESLEGMLASKQIPIGIAFATPSKLVVDMVKAAEGAIQPTIAVPSRPTDPEHPQPAQGNQGGQPVQSNNQGPGGNGQGGQDGGVNKGNVWQWGIVAALFVVFIAVAIMITSNKGKAAPEKSLAEPAVPPQPSFSKRTTISLGTVHCTHGELAGKTFPMTEKGLMIGRDTECDIMLNSDVISRRHSWIGPKGDDIAVRDMGSTNGTYINGRKVDGLVLLQKGDAISLSKSGQEIFHFAD